MGNRNDWFFSTSYSLLKDDEIVLRSVIQTLKSQSQIQWSENEKIANSGLLAVVHRQPLKERLRGSAAEIYRVRHCWKIKFGTCADTPPFEIEARIHNAYVSSPCKRIEGQKRELEITIPLPSTAFSVSGRAEREREEEEEGRETIHVSSSQVFSEVSVHTAGSSEDCETLISQRLGKITY